MWFSGDFNGDGLTDLETAAPRQGSTIDVLLNVHDADSFERKLGTGTGPHVGWSHLETKWFTGDFNGDGLTDFAAAVPWEGSAVDMFMTHPGVVGFTPKPGASTGLRVSWSHSETEWFSGDFNGDAVSDVAVAVPWKGSAVDIFIRECR